ncbi:Uncharacterized protein TPAR_04029 [Tolypocladium paradoxum]|uniref:Alkyl hydroperoxide reductase subunit C/ Thiol specific antioxidant domain-containing protein n=1 Tax=Tolypocladium paradoxum TaxID=94208 RepID=A0A2S4L044_9HYPO|nr:Uncharacterized protein TPAR_04029 [Tolypocladium paradoxum]
MLSSLTTKIALKKLGLPSDALDFSTSSPAAAAPPRPNKLKKTPSGAAADPNDDGGGGSSGGGGWAGWVSVKNLPLTVHPWFSPPPPPVPVARVPRVGDVAPRDRDRKLEFGGGRRVLVVFLRCVGCAFAQKTFLALRALANRHAGAVTFVAVSHSSPRATAKWLDLVGGAWNVQAWRENGWLGGQVADAIQRRGGVQSVAAQGDDDAASTVLGNKWQEAGAFAVDGRGTVIWGGKALRADDVMDLDEGARLLCM